MIFSILISKLTAMLLSLFKKGSSFPGAVALKLTPNILSKLKLPERIIAVTGSNGKTSVTELIFTEALKTGKLVICNHEGSNQIQGVTALFIKHSTIFGRVKADIAVIETDERFCAHIFRFFTPEAIVVTNLFRDQMTRNGHSEFVYDRLKNGLPLSSTLILNADDPLSASLGTLFDHVLYFGVDPLAFYEEREATHACDDGRFCPICRGRLEYRYRLHNHLGDYRCKNCGYSRAEPNHSITAQRGRSFVADGLYDIKPQLLSSMFAENIAAAFTVGVEILSLEGEVAAEALDGYTLKNGRLKKFSAGEHKGMFMLTKHENILAYNGALESVVKSRSKEKTVVLIIDLLSRKHSANDMSWLWDIDFELLQNERINKIILSGGFAYDLAVRLDFAGVDSSKIAVQPDIRAMTASLGADAAGEIFVMTCFTDQAKFMSRFKRGAT